MIEERHRLLALEAYTAYVEDRLPITRFAVSQFRQNGFDALKYDRLIYVLRLAPSGKKKSPSIAAIPNLNDQYNILYIGGQKSGGSSRRYNKLVDACLEAERIYERNGYAHNDKKHAHPVANKLTTSLLKLGFSINDCLLDIVDGGERFDELELLIGYEESFHHLPPWNAIRDGYSAYRD